MNKSDEVKVHEKNINAPVTRKRVVIFGKEGAIEGMLVESLRRLGHDVIFDTVNNVTWYEHQIKEADVVFADSSLENYVTIQQLCLNHDKSLLKVRGINDIVNGMVKEMEKLNLNEGYNKVGEKTTDTPASKVYPSKDGKMEKSIEEVMKEEGAKPLFEDKEEKTDEPDPATTEL